MSLSLPLYLYLYFQISISGQELALRALSWYVLGDAHSLNEALNHGTGRRSARALGQE